MIFHAHMQVSLQSRYVCNNVICNIIVILIQLSIESFISHSLRPHLLIRSLWISCLLSAILSHLLSYAICIFLCSRCDRLWSLLFPSGIYRSTQHSGQACCCCDLSCIWQGMLSVSAEVISSSDVSGTVFLLLFRHSVNNLNENT